MTTELKPCAVPDMPELVRYTFRRKGMFENPYGSYVRHDQAAAMIDDLSCLLNDKQGQIDRLEAELVLMKERSDKINDHTPVAHAYVVDGECEQIDWGTDIYLPDDTSLTLLYATPVAGEAETIERCAKLCESNIELLGRGNVRSLEPFPDDIAFSGAQHSGMTYAAAIRALSGKEPS